MGYTCTARQMKRHRTEFNWAVSRETSELTWWLQKQIEASIGLMFDYLLVRSKSPRLPCKIKTKQRALALWYSVQLQFYHNRFVCLTQIHGAAFNRLHIDPLEENWITCSAHINEFDTFFISLPWPSSSDRWKYVGNRQTVHEYHAMLTRLHLAGCSFALTRGTEKNL